MNKPVFLLLRGKKLNLLKKKIPGSRLSLSEYMNVFYYDFRVGRK